jgi:membrane fusion protein, heavy metal efflux system
VTARISSPIPGRVLAGHAEIGDAVSRNMDLLDVDSPDFAAAEADWEKAQADQDRKKLAFERAKLLLQHEVIPRKDFESADADYRQAAAEARRARLRLHNLDASMRERGNDGRFALRSPISGVVTEKQINPGLEIRPDLPNPLFVISDITRLWVLIDLPEHSISHVHRGQRITVVTDTYPGERFAGEVDRIGLALDPATRRIPVRCSVVNPDKKLKPEMFARVAFIADGNRRGIQVPNTSLVLDGLHSFVFVETEPGVFRKRRVNIAIRGTDDSFIDGGLAAGERVVTEGALLLNSEIVNDAQ